MPLSDSPLPETHEFIVPDAHHRDRLDRTLVANLTGGWSRSCLSSWIKQGRVTMQGSPVLFPSQPVEQGARIQLTVPIPVVVEAKSSFAPTILHQDDHFLVLAKPTGLLMHGNRLGDTRPSVASWLEQNFSGDLPSKQGAERPGIVHRLDKETSGVCVVALTEPACQDLMAQFANRTIVKEYSALVVGVPRFESDWIESRLHPEPRRPDRVRVTQKSDSKTRDAATYWEILERFPEAAWLKIIPRTGRKHQIRVHLASEGLPIMGDPIYRGRRGNEVVFSGGVPPRRTLLHASSLQFKNPSTEKKETFVAPLPEDFQNVLNLLRQPSS